MATEDQTNCATIENHPRKDEDFLLRLQKLPNLFFQDCAKKATKASLSTTLESIERTQQSQDEAFENPRNPKNLVTFLQWMLGHVPEAEAMAAREVQERPSDILALSNSAYALWQKGETGQAWGRLEELEALRDGPPQQYDDLEVEAQFDILCLYSRLGHMFRPYEVSELQEKLLLRRPHDDSLKYTLAQTLHRYTYDSYTYKYPDVDFTPAARRAMELYVQIKEREENSPDFRGTAAAKLYKILSRQKNKYIKNAIEAERCRLELTADRCFEEVLGLAENNPAVLLDAAIYFRYLKKRDKSRELLEKAVVLHPEKKAHHLLGTVLEQLAFQRVSPPRGELTPHRPLSKDAEHVQEAMEQFHKALEVSNWTYVPALYHIGLIHSALGEYDQALQQFQKTLELAQPISYLFNKATKQAGHVFEEMAKGEKNHKRQEALEKMGRFCLNQTLSNQSRRMLTITRINETFWHSLYSLHQALRYKRFKELKENTSLTEDLMLTTAKNYSNRLPALRDLTGYSKREAEDARVLERAVQGYITNGRYDDALLFLSLLKLTQQKHMLATWQDADVYVRVHVLVAEDRLLECVGRNDVLADLNVTAAKLMFQQAFEDVFSPAGNSTTTSLSQAAPTPGETLADVSSPEVNDDVNDAMNVCLLHDPRDTEAERDARNLQAVLQEICGLKTALMCDEQQLGAARSALGNTATNADLLVIVVSGDVSPEFSAWLSEVINTTTAGAVGLSHGPDPPSSSHRLVTLVLNSSPLPPALQGHRSFSVSSSKLLELGEGQRPRSEAGVRSVCKLFHGLIGLQM